jgi:hypothetical protein
VAAAQRWDIQQAELDFLAGVARQTTIAIGARCT